MYGLIWRPVALDELSDIWVAATRQERDDWGPRLKRVNRQLRIDPFELGESRDADYRVVFVGPVVIWLTVEKADGLVFVRHVHRMR